MSHLISRVLLVILVPIFTEFSDFLGIIPRVLSDDLLLLGNILVML